MGLWEATNCTYMDWECIGKAVERDPPDCGDNVKCWVYVLVKLPPCKLEDEKCWKEFEALMKGMDDDKCPGGKNGKDAEKGAEKDRKKRKGKGKGKKGKGRRGKRLD